MIRNSLGRALALALTLVSTSNALAEASPNVLINHTGRLLDADDRPIETPTNLTFALYPAREGASAVWNASYTVSPLGGLYSLMLGDTTGGKPALTAEHVAGERWLEVNIGGQVLTPRMRLGTVPSAAFAASAASAESAASADDARMLGGRPAADYVLEGDLAPVALSGKYSDLVGGPDLSPYAKTESLSKVATSGAYADLVGGPDLSPYAKTAALSKVATSGSFGDLTNVPKFAQLGADCQPGLVVKGLKADGSYNCVNPVDADAMPADAIDEISNGLIHNQFVDSVAGARGVKIPDNNPVGVSDTIDFPDLGIAQGLSVSVDLSNSNIANVKVSLFDPSNAEYVLFNGGANGTTLKATYPTPTPSVTGNLASWINRNPKGKWFLKVVDSAYLNNSFDGQINAWSINVQTLSSKKVRIAGNLVAEGSIQIGADAGACDASKRGALRMEPTYGLETCTGTDWVSAVPKPAIWSGGCTSHAQGSGEATYCLNGVDNNTASKYLDVNANGTVTIKIDGHYRINAWMDGTSCSYRRIILRTTPVGQAERDLSYSHIYNNSGGWHQLQMDQTFPFRKGDTFRIVSQNDCGGGYYKWHSWNDKGQHSRAQFTFAGPLN